MDLMDGVQPVRAPPFSAAPARTFASKYMPADVVDKLGLGGGSRAASPARSGAAQGLSGGPPILPQVNSNSIGSKRTAAQMMEGQGDMLVDGPQAGVRAAPALAAAAAAGSGGAAPAAAAVGGGGAAAAAVAAGGGGAAPAAGAAGGGWESALALLRRYAATADSMDNAQRIALLVSK
jgi:hypothetical protein